MTRGKIERYQQIRREYACLETRLETIEARMLTAAKVADVKVQTCGTTSDMVAEIAVELVEVKEKIRNKLVELITLEKQISEYIDSLPDGLSKQVLILRVLDGLTFRRIANILHYSSTAVFKIYQNTLNKRFE